MTVDSFCVKIFSVIGHFHGERVNKLLITTIISALIPKIIIKEIAHVSPAIYTIGLVPNIRKVFDMKNNIFVLFP